jgi:hypothetical protein
VLVLLIPPSKDRKGVYFLKKAIST